MNRQAKRACRQGRALEKIPAWDGFHKVLCLWTLRGAGLFKPVFGVPPLGGSELFGAVCFVTFSHLGRRGIAFVHVNPVAESDGLAGINGHVASVLFRFLEFVQAKWIR